MRTIKRLSLATVTAAASGALVASPSLAAETPSPEDSPQDASINLSQVDESGFDVTLTEGQFEERSDGSVAIVDDSGNDVALLATELDLAGNEGASVEYALADSQSLEASFSEEVDPDDLQWEEAAPGVQSRSGIDCASSAALFAGGTAAVFGAALTAPFTAGGSLVVAGAALGASATTVDFARDCYG